MAHPGRIVYSHPPNTDGVSFFYIVYRQRGHSCELRAANLQGEKLTVEFPVVELLNRLEDGEVDGACWDAEVARRAAKQVRLLAQRRHLI
jgi:hypothetical protein